MVFFYVLSVLMVLYLNLLILRLSKTIWAANSLLFDIKGINLVLLLLAERSFLSPFLLPDHCIKHAVVKVFFIVIK